LVYSINIISVYSSHWTGTFLRLLNIQATTFPAGVAVLIVLKAMISVGELLWYKLFLTGSACELIYLIN